MKIIGITGGIGSGKSTVSRMIRERGYPVIDLDILAHRVIEPGEPAYRKIVARFGTEILGPDRKIDRRRLGQRVFPDQEARRELESFTHPEISTLMEREIQTHREEGCTLLFLEVPLLYEVGMDSWIRPVIVVKSPEAICIERLKSRKDLLSDQEILSRMRSQMNIEEKTRRADYVIDNSGNPENTRSQLNDIIQKLIS